MRGDTSPEALAFLRERTSALSPEQRLAEGFAAIRLGRQLMRAGIRARHPDYDEDRVEHALARMLWGDELYRRVYPHHPLLES
jgi:hypothetical protein